MQQRKIIAIGLSTIALFGAGCFSRTTIDVDNDDGVATSAESGIRGTVTIGPTCPVETDPPQPECAPRPYSGVFIVTTESGERIKTFRSDADGRFSVALDPGVYVVAMESESGLPFLKPLEFVVFANAYTELDFMADSGIR